MPQHNNGMHPTANNVALIRKTWRLDPLGARRVMPGVMSPLRIDAQLNPAVPLLCQAEVDEIIEWLVECRCELNQPMMKAHGIRRQLSRCCLETSIVRRGGIRSYNITTHSTGAELACFSSARLNACFVVSRPVNSGVMR